MTPREPVGRLAIVLHTHMPEVIGHGVWPFGEQWLWETVCTSYLRVADAVRGKAVTIGLTPVLADQLEAMRGEPGDRLCDWVSGERGSREYLYAEDMNAFEQVGRPDLKEALAPQMAGYRREIVRFETEFARDLNSMFGELSRDGAELLAGPATHPVMPLLATDSGRDLQLARGIESHARRFGKAAGIWLPECAWDRGLDRALARAGVEYFCVDQSGRFGEASLKNLEPIATPSGPIAIPLDWQMVAKVWRADGYPASGAYRSTFNLTSHGLMPYDNNGDAWDAEGARSQAKAHADAFLRSLAARLEHYADERGRPGTSVFAADTELFGHWWYEGPWWLEAVLELAQDYGIELVTLGEAARECEPAERDLLRSSWGRNKSLETWDSPNIASMVWDQRRAELDFDRAVAFGRVGDRQRAEQELLALQSSDWAFMESNRSAGDYGARRFAEHLASFESALGG